MHSTTGQIATDQIVHNYLDDLEHLLQHADADSVAVMAPAELDRTIRTLRAILDGHDSESRDRCRRCTTRWAWWRHQARPCRMWQIAYQHLVAAAPTHPTGPIMPIGGPR